MITVRRHLVAFCTRTWVWSLALVFAVTLLLWYVGPLLSIADHRPWAAVENRLLSICVVLLGWGLSMALGHSRPSARAARPEDNDQEVRWRGKDERRELHRRFTEAWRTLKRAPLLRGRRHTLPWYLLLGPEQAGKTSLLNCSGLDFPLELGEQRRGADPASTEYADWRFAEHAVLVDTAGRYLSQGDRAVDTQGWLALLGLLRRRRGRALNGVLLVIPVEWLQRDDEQVLENLARQVRQRLSELHQQLRIEVPIYLVLSKADGLPGFAAFFEQLSRDECDQVFGATFRQDRAAGDEQQLREEFDELLRRLNLQLIQRLHQERDVQRRGELLGFPTQLARIAERLGLFVELALAGNRYQRANLLRGFYFTSAPQDDAPLAHDGLRLSRPRFIQQLLGRVIFPEAELATLEHHTARRLRWQHRLLYLTASLCLIGCSLWWANGFNAVHERLERLRELATSLAIPSAPNDPAAALAELDSGYSATQVFPAPQDVPWREQAGLYPYANVAPVVDQAYHQQLQKVLLPRIVTQLEAQLRASLADREQLLGNLRAYLMLGRADHRDPAYLRDWMARSWAIRYASVATKQRRLNEHFARLLDSSFPPPALNAQLLAQARDMLHGESLADLVYERLRERASTLPDYRLAERLSGANAWLAGGDYTIPGFYTQRGYQQVFSTSSLATLHAVLRDHWLLGTAEELQAADLTALQQEVEQRYFRDYGQYWDKAINHLSVMPIASLEQGAAELAALAAVDSPLLTLLVEVRANTRFPAQPFIEDTQAASTQLLTRAGQPNARDMLERRFATLHRLLDDSGAPTGRLASALQSIIDSQRQLAAVASSGDPQQSAFELAKARMLSSQDSLAQLRNDAAHLPQPLAGWLNAASQDCWRQVLGGAYRYIAQRYRHDVYDMYKDALQQRYPFNLRSESEVALSDFREFFKQRGRIERFVTDYLQPFLKQEGSEYRMRLVDDQSLPLSPAVLVQFSRADAIRRGFFTENPTEPQVRFQLEPLSLDASLGRSELRVGDQLLEYRHGPIVQAAFHWPVDAENGRSSLVLEGLDGRRVGIERSSGPWAFFRLLDLMSVQYHSGRDVLRVEANLAGLQTRYLLHSQRAPNPFDLGALRQFRLPATL